MNKKKYHIPSSPNDQLSDAESQIEQAIRKAFIEMPPTLGVIGVSGTGKSSTLNSMFNTNLAISHVVACTKEFIDTDIAVKFSSEQSTMQTAALRVVDAPGLGEDIARDPEYLEKYHKNLERCDAVLWVLSARNRAVALDQMYLKELKQYHDKIVFGINQVDILEPNNWNSKTNLPSQEQISNMQVVLEDRKKKLESIIKRDISIAVYSAKRRYRLANVYEMLINAAPTDRSWMFEPIKGFNALDWMPEVARETVEKILNSSETPSKKRKNWFKL